MSFFQDFADALESYIDDSVTVSIVDVEVVTELGGARDVNVNEIFKFKVNVENDGHINMTDVRLHVTGRSDTTVSTTGPAGPFEDNFQTFGSLTVNGGSSQKSEYLYFKAPDEEKPAGTTLVEAHIDDWGGNLAHMFDNHTRHDGSTSGTYANQVEKP